MTRATLLALLYATLTDRLPRHEVHPFAVRLVVS
jgi:hypothetical protein